jgi:hypothetical protein
LKPTDAFEEWFNFCGLLDLRYPCNQGCRTKNPSPAAQPSDKLLLMKIGTLALLLSLALPVFSQQAEDPGQDLKIILGKNWITSEDITGLEFALDDRVTNYFLDTATNTLTLQVRKLSKSGKKFKKEGELVLFDLQSKKVRWRKPFDYSDHFLIQSNNFLVETKEKKSYGISLETGNRLWEINNELTYIDPFTPVGLGYTTQTFFSTEDRLFAVHLKTGKLLWTRTIDNKYGWDDFYHINDSVMVIASSGVHSLNLYTGKGWDYTATTGRDNYSGTIVTNLIGIAASLLTGTLESYSPSADFTKITSIASNVLEDSSFLYFSSRDRIACVQKDSGNVFWSSKLPKHMTGKTTLHIHKLVLYAVCYGYAYAEGDKVIQGQPYVAAFDILNGSQKYLHALPSDEYINTLYFKDDHVYVLFNNSMISYNLAEGKPISIQAYKPDSIGNLEYFLSDEVFFNNQSAIFKVTQSDTTKQYVYTSKGKILILDEQLNIVKLIDYPEPLVAYATSGGYTFLSQGGKTIIVNKDARKIAELDVSDQSILANKKLYCVQGNKLVEIDLGELLPE